MCQMVAPCKRSLSNFKSFAFEELIPKYQGRSLSFDKSSISLRTARNWMISIGYRYGNWKKDVYVDGHEREDVLESRKEFLAQMTNFFDNMAGFVGDSMVLTRAHISSEVEIVWVTHDESNLYAIDDIEKGWSSKAVPDLHKKGRGRSIMVSEFLCPCHCRLYFLDAHE